MTHPLLTLSTPPQSFGQAFDLSDDLRPCRFILLADLRQHFRRNNGYHSYHGVDLTDLDLRLALAWIGFWGAAEFRGSLMQAVKWMHARRPPLDRPVHHERVCIYTRA